MKNILALITLLALGTAPAFAAGPQAPAPKILVIDRGAILQFSKVGQDIAKQIQAMSQQAKNDLTAQGKALQNEGQQLQQQIAILAPDVKAKRVADFEAKQQAFQGAAQKREQQIQGGFLQARTQVEQALAPIVQQIVATRGANMVLDKQAVVYANNNGFDITLDAINLLNQKLSTLKVSLANPPANAAAAAARQ